MTGTNSAISCLRVAALVGPLLWSVAAPAIYVRHDVLPVTEFSDLAAEAQFMAAGFFVGGCSGVLIGATTVLTAAHCGVATNAEFGMALDRTGATTYTVGSVVNHPLYGSTPEALRNQYDLTLVTLIDPVNTITPATIHTADMLGEEVTMVGYGGQGYGNAAVFPSASVTDRLAATNVIDFKTKDVLDSSNNVVTLRMWGSDFDSPAGDGNVDDDLSSPTPTALEGNLAGGDSGSPLLWNGFLVGIGSLTFCPRAPCIPPAYGYGSLWAALDLPENQQFLRDYGIAMVPVAAPVWFLVTGLGALAGFRRRRGSSRKRA